MKPETRNFYEAAVVRAVERVCGALDDALDLEALARESALSVFHFHRVFRGLVGETPLELRRRLRMERAAEQLGEAGARITTVAFRAGYETHEAFTRSFKERYGMAPSVFRTKVAKGVHRCHAHPLTALPARCGLHVSAGGIDMDLLLLASGDSTMDVTIETLPERRLATVRHVGPYADIADAFHRLGLIASQHGLYAHVEPAMLALYHDDPETIPTNELRSDAALVVRDRVALPESLVEVTLPAGCYARTSHRGAYAGLGDAWARLMGEWLPGSGHRLGDGPSFELYVNDPRTTETQDLRTDLYVPLADG